MPNKKAPGRKAPRAKDKSYSGMATITQERNILMNNEEKILVLLEKMETRQEKTDAILEAMQGQMDTMQGQMEQMNGRLDRLEQGQAGMRKDIGDIKEDIDIVKEDVAITRTATNTLLDWAEKAEVQIRIPLYNKAE